MNCCTTCGAKPKQGTTGFRFFRRVKKTALRPRLHVCDECHNKKEG
jgi:hypothetical protein